MELKYVKSQSGSYPVSPDTTSSKKFVYLRDNVVVIQSEDMDGKIYTYYEYDEAKLTKEEYERYLEDLGSTETLGNIETLKAENQMLTEQVDMLTMCVLEMSEIVYV